jgi:hypothetical protein
MDDKCLQEGYDSLLHVGVCCQSLASQVLLKEPKEMQITRRVIWRAGSAVHSPAFHTPTVWACLCVLYGPQNKDVVFVMGN